MTENDMINIVTGTADPLTRNSSHVQAFVHNCITAPGSSLYQAWSGNQEANFITMHRNSTEGKFCLLKQNHNLIRFDDHMLHCFSVFNVDIVNQFLVTLSEIYERVYTYVQSQYSFKKNMHHMQ